MQFPPFEFPNNNQSREIHSSSTFDVQPPSLTLQNFQDENEIETDNGQNNNNSSNNNNNVEDCFPIIKQEDLPLNSFQINTNQDIRMPFLSFVKKHDSFKLPDSSKDYELVKSTLNERQVAFKNSIPPSHQSFSSFLEKKQSQHNQFLPPIISKQSQQYFDNKLQQLSHFAPEFFQSSHFQQSSQSSQYKQPSAQFELSFQLQSLDPPPNNHFANNFNFNNNNNNEMQSTFQFVSPEFGANENEHKNISNNNNNNSSSFSSCESKSNSKDNNNDDNNLFNNQNNDVEQYSPNNNCNSSSNNQFEFEDMNLKREQSSPKERNSFLDEEEEADQQALQQSPPLKKQQSLFKNANKFFISNFLNYIVTILNHESDVYLYTMNIKKTGKSNRKVDLFTLVHFRLLFLKLNTKNFSQLNNQDIQLHAQVFGLSEQLSQWTEEQICKINEIKDFFCREGKSYFMLNEDNEIYMKIQGKNWDQDMKAGYMKWVSRIYKKISEMDKGEYVYRI